MTPIWQPQPRQALALACPVRDLFFGGARGGGKSDFLLGDWIRHAETYGETARGLLLRRTMPQLTELLDRSKQIYTHLNWRWFEKKSQWVTDKGAILHMKYLDKDSDAENYQGWNLNWVGIDEAGNFPSPVPIDKLYATLRSAAGVKTVMRLTGNPGGAGHGWLKRRYIDPADQMVPFEDENGHERVFIPSKLDDNIILKQNDPEYVDRLKLVGSEDLVKAWLEGDWNVSLGQFFPEWDEEKMVIPTVDIPPHWIKICGLDWGYKTPFCVLWAAVSDGTPLARNITLPKGALVFYREYYGGYVNDRGFRYPSDKVAEEIIARESERIDTRIADYQIFRQDNGPSIAEGFSDKGVFFRACDKNRIPGWNQMRVRMQGGQFYVMDTCKYLIRQMPVMVHDEKDAEDCLKVPEDHPVDTARYICMARPYYNERFDAKNLDMRSIYDLPLGDLLKLQPKAKGRQRLEGY